jgi:hypothetical protein
MDRITAGEFDTKYFIPCAKAVAAIGDPVLVNLWYESNGSHNPYWPGFQGTIGTVLGTRGTGETTYVNAWRHVVSVFRAQGASNAIFVFAQQTVQNYGFYQNLWPGDDVVDVMMVDLYRNTFRSRCLNPGTTGGGVNSQDYYLFSQGTALTTGQATSLNRAHNVAICFGIAEAGLRDGQGYQDVAAAGGDGQTYYKNADNGNDGVAKLQQDMKDFPNTCFYIHWNELGSPALSGTGNYIDKPAGALPRYKALYNDSYYGLFYGGTAVNQPPTLVTAPVTDKNPTVGTATTTTPGTWNGSPVPTETYQWQSSATQNGTYANISGATSQSYTPVTGDVSKFLRCQVTAANGVSPNGVAVTDPTNAVVAAGTSGALQTAPTANVPDYSSTAWTPNNNLAGRVHGIVELNNVVYVSGDYDTVTDPNGTVHSNMPYLSAYRMDTGAAIATWRPNPSATCFKLALSADGTKLYVGYAGTTVAGVTRHYVFAVNTLSGPTDATAATAQSILPDLSTLDGTVRKVLLDEANSRAWIFGSFTGFVKRLTLSGTWSISSGFNPPVFSQGSGSAPPRLHAALLTHDGSKIVMGGANISPTGIALDPNTGLTASWSYSPSNTVPGIFDIQTTGTVVYVAGGDQSGDMLFCCNESGGGPNALTFPNGNTHQGNWYHVCDGNVQVIAPDNAHSRIYYGHLGDNAATHINSGTLDQVRHGLVTMPSGLTGGDMLPFGHPPDFTNPTVGGQATGSPQKLFAMHIGPSGALHVGGDFTGVNGSAGNAFQRYARFDPVTSGVPTNTTIPTVTANNPPQVGDVVTGNDGTWGGTPTSYTRQWYRKDAVGNVARITGATSTTYTVVTGDVGFQLIYGVKAVNGTGSSVEARSNPTAIVPSPPTGAPATPVLDPGNLPANPTQVTTFQFTWTDPDVPDHWRYRLLTDGTPGAWTITNSQLANVNTPGGHTYQFEVQAGSAGNQYSASATFPWVVQTPLVAAPVLTFKPLANTSAKSVAFAWTVAGADSGYRYKYAFDTPAGVGTWSSVQREPCADFVGPLVPGAYSFHVQAIDGTGMPSIVTDWPFVVVLPAGTIAPALVQYPPIQDSDTTPTFGWA